MFLIKTASALKSLNFSAQLIQISSYYAVWFLFQEVFNFFIFKTNYIHSTTLLIVQWNSRTFLAYRTESNRIKHGFAGSELFQYFDVFFEFGSIEPNSVLLHLNDFIWCIWCIWMIFMSRVRSNRTRKNSGNIEKIRFGSIFQESSRVSL